MSPSARTLAMVGLAAMSAVWIGATPAAAQDNAIRSHPGFVDFDIIPRTISMEPNVEVNIKGALLRLAAEATVREDPDLAEMLRNLKLIRVFSYENQDWSDEQMSSFSGLARRIGAQLEEKGWDMVARVREDDELVFVYLRELNEVVEGMVVMVMDGEEAVFVNITGTIDPAQIGRIGSRFDIDALEDVRIDQR